jgi:hypothetical protein
MKQVIQALRGIIFSSALIMAGCGGSDNSVEQVDVAIAADLQLKVGRTIQLTPTVQHEKPDFTYRWQQVSGPLLQLSSTSSKQIDITAPALSSDALAVLSLTVTTSSGKQATATTKVLLKTNQLPQVAINDVLLQEKSQALLSVTAQDTDGTIQQIDWQQIGGPALIFTAVNSAQLAVTMPAIGKVEYARFVIRVTDDDGATTVVEHNFKLEPLWQEFTISGFLAARLMGGAEVSAQVNNEVFRTYAEANGSYNLTLKLDDDATDDFVLLQASSIEKPGLELRRALPSLRNKPAAEPVSITPYSTAILALAMRVNNDALPNSRASLQRVETVISAAEAGEAALMIAAFAEQGLVSLPSGQLSLFETVANRDSYRQYRDALRATVPELLDTLHEKLPQQGWGKIDISAQQLALGLRLESDHDGNNELATQHYLLVGNNQLQVANQYFSYSGDWSILFGSLLSHGATADMPLYQLSVDNPDLGLTAEQVTALKQEGHTTLDVKITLLGEQLSQVSRGVFRHLYLRRLQLGYQLQSVMLNGEQLEFLPQEVETEHYAWGTVLHPSTLSVTEQMILGQWTVPVYQATNILDQARLQPQELVFTNNGEGYSIDSGETFNWSIIGLPGNSWLQLEFASGYYQHFRITAQVTAGFIADIYVIDANGRWLAAQAGSFYRLWGI